MKFRPYFPAALNLFAFVIFETGTYFVRGTRITFVDNVLWATSLLVTTILVILGIFYFLTDRKKHKLVWQFAGLLFVMCGIFLVGLGIFDFIVGNALRSWGGQQ